MRLEHTSMQVSEQCLQFGVAVQVVVFCQVAPEGLDGGSALLQNPGQEGIHGLVDSFSALPLQSVLHIHTNRERFITCVKIQIHIISYCLSMSWVIWRQANYPQVAQILIIKNIHFFEGHEVKLTTLKIINCLTVLCVCL